jgi:nucleoid-associated protein YgaU
MTSEAKIGLLLGLVFIFIIAFVINGLPSFWNKTNSNELTTVAGGPANDTLGLGEGERTAQETIEKMEPAASESAAGTQNIQGDVRFAAELPKDSTKTVQTTELQQTTVAQAPPSEVIAENSSEITAQSPATEQQTYVVCNGDSLYTIAKKFYGAAEANRKSTLDMLFRANRSTMKSPHTLKIGQKLVIPPLSAKSSQKSRIENVSVTTTKKVQSTDVQQLSADDGTPKQTRDYVVQNGDSLWKIAAKQLGNGSRYDEIIEMNSDVLQNEDNLTVGMHLKLPAR